MNKMKIIQKDMMIPIVKWILWCVPAVTVVALVLSYFLSEEQIYVEEVIINSNGIFIFVAGILMTPLFFTWVFKLGITRHMFFKTVALVMINLTIIVTVLMLFITFVLSFNPWVPVNVPEWQHTALSVCMTYLLGIMGSVTGAAFYLDLKYGLTFVLMLGLFITAASFLGAGGVTGNVFIGFTAVIVLIPLLLLILYRTVSRMPVKL